MGIPVCKDAPICKDFQKFMRNDTNKTELFKMIDEAVIQIPETLDTIVATSGSKILSNSSLEKLNIEPCNQEEADTILLLHVPDGANSGIKKVSLINVDADAVVLDCGIFLLWILTSCALNLKLTNIEDTFRFIHVPKHLVGLTLWHALTGCDTVSSFKGKGKKTAWKVLRLSDEGLAKFVR